MYLQITSKCNMLCDHCCGDYGPEGEDMEMHVFKEALNLCDAWGMESISLGGGEPTVHPQFWEMVGLALTYPFSIWMATNGKRKKDALRLLQMVRDDKLSVDLSMDIWHEEISYEVSDAFRTYEKRARYTGNHAARIRDITSGIHSAPIRAGRAAKLLSDWDLRDDCVCAGMMTLPNGDIKACGCEDSPIVGNVWEGIGTEKYPYATYDDCWKNWEEIEEYAS